MPSLEVAEVVLARYNLLDNQYQQKYVVLHTFTPNKFYSYFLNVEPSNLVFLKSYNTEFVEIIITFKDQNGRRYSKTKTRKYVKGYLSFA